MCKSSSAMEDVEHANGYIVNSVVLRIMMQDNCTCRVTIDNQVGPVSIGLRKYGGLSSSAPEEYGCGLAVDINHIPYMSVGNASTPMECVVNGDLRNIQVAQNSVLQLKSRIINGTFTRGYCMQIQRGNV